MATLIALKSEAERVLALSAPLKPATNATTTATIALRTWCAAPPLSFAREADRA